MQGMRRRAGAATALVVLAALIAAPARAQNQSADGWPPMTGMLLMNKTDTSRPLDARPGRDPFGGRDRSYSCDAVHERGACQQRLVSCDAGRCVTGRAGHNKLLGGHGDDTIHAGPWGDVLWGDYKPSGQPTSQRDRLTGGAGRDFIYASHGWNTIRAGGGDDFVKAHFGRGIVDCGGGRDTLYISRRALRAKRYKIRGCERRSHRTRPA